MMLRNGTRVAMKVSRQIIVFGFSVGTVLGLGACSPAPPLASVSPSDEVSLGLEAARKGKHAEAIQHYKKVSAHRHLCTEYALLGAWDLAIASCQRALEINRADASAANGLRYATRGKATEDLSLAPALINLGMKLFNEGDFVQAIKVWTRVPSQSPQYATSRNNLASAFILTKDLLSAKSNLDEALRLEPDNQLFRNNLEWLKREQTKGAP